MSNDIVRVDFYGEQLDTIRNADGVWVSLRRLCENVGIDFSGQLQKLRGKPWAVMEMISTTGPDGKKYETTMIHLDCVPMLLATVDADRVPIDVRSKVELYQRECAKALRDYWFGGEAVNPRREPTHHRITNDRAKVIAIAVRETRALMKAAGVPPDMIAACMIETLQTNLEADLSAARKGLPAKATVPELMNATEVGKHFGVSAKAANEVIERAGLQYHEGDGWQITEAGKQHGEAKPYTRNGHTGYQVRWKLSVLDAIASHFPVALASRVEKEVAAIAHCSWRPTSRRRKRGCCERNHTPWHICRHRGALVCLHGDGALESRVRK